MSEVIVNYYPFHIGDFNNATRHLDRIERSIYRDLIDLYYDKESPLPENVEQVARLICANDCVTSVEQVLNEFFYLTDSGWVNDRCEQTLTEYKELSEKRSKAGKASAKARRSLKAKQKPVPTSVEQVLNKCITSEVQTNNHKPITKTKTIYRDSLRELCVPENLINDFLKVRKKKNAVDSETSWRGFMREVDKANLPVQQVVQICIERDWKGFKAEWIQDSKPVNQEMSQIDRVAAKLEMEMMSGHQNHKALI